VLNSEVPQILAGFKMVNENYSPKFAEILITKRISDRVFGYGQITSGYGANKVSRGEGFVNPTSGTLVAADIVSNDGFDYLLVAQNVTQGTCTPTRYNVIYDTTGLT